MCEYCKERKIMNTNGTNFTIGHFTDLGRDEHFIYTTGTDSDYHSLDINYCPMCGGKMMSKYNKPVLLVHESDGQCSGSTRSPIPIKSIYKDSGLFDLAQGHEQSLGISYKLSNEHAIIGYLDSVVSDCEPYTDVICVCETKHTPRELFSLTETYKHLWSNGVSSPVVAFKPFTIYNTDIKILGKGSTIKFTKDGIDFISFFTSNDIKERLYMNVDEKVKLEIEIVGELCYNEFREKKSKQCVSI